MKNAINATCDTPALHVRAKAILAKYGNALQDAGRPDDLVFMNATVRRNVNKGNDKQKERMQEVETFIAGLISDADISGCIKSNRS